MFDLTGKQSNPRPLDSHVLNKCADRPVGKGFDISVTSRFTLSYRHCLSGLVLLSGSESHRRARQRCFWLLAFISRPQIRNIHLPRRMILPGSSTPSLKYFLKNLTFVVRNPLVWLRHHSSQTLYCYSLCAVIASDPTRGSRHDFSSGRPGRTLLFSCCSESQLMAL